MADFQSIAPWAHGRPSLYSFLKERMAELKNGDTRCDLPCDKFQKEAYQKGAFSLPFRELVLRLDLFSAVVEPAVADLSGDVVLAPILLDLLEKTVRRVDATACLALYQLLIARNLWRYETLQELESLLDTGTLIHDPLMHDFLLWMLSSTPDEKPAAFALCLLGRTTPAPPRELLYLFALHDRFCSSACGTIVDCHYDTEDLLIDIAKAHAGWGRIYAIRCLSSVLKPENQRWLLSDGWKTDYTPYLAAVYGDLIGRLRAGNLDLDELVGLATILDTMQVPFPDEVKGLADYADGPEAYRLVIEYCERLPLDARLFRLIARLVNFLETAGFDDTPERSRIWTPEVRLDLAVKGRRYLAKPEWPDDLTRRWSKTYQAEAPTLQWLADGDLSRFHEVLQAAIESQDLEDLIDWAAAILFLSDSAEAQAERRRELEQIGMPGICSGGIYGLTESKLNSVYGQIVLQILQALPETPGIGWKMIQTGLRSDTRFHRLAAAEALANWADDRLTPEVIEELKNARRDCDDDAAIAAIDKVLLRSPSHPEGTVQ